MGAKAKNKVISGYLNGASITHFFRRYSDFWLCR